MARGISHSRRNRLVGRRGSQTVASQGTTTQTSASQGTATQTSASQGTTTTGSTSKRSRTAAPPEVEPPKKRGRKPGKRTELKPVPQTGPVPLVPRGDMQFRYVDFESAPYKYNTQLGVILKREYPGVIQERNKDGVLVREKAALEWADYFLGAANAEGLTNGDCVLSEFWRLFRVEEEYQAEADRVLDNHLKKKVRDTMYQARVDCVKTYYRKRGESIDDTLARTMELEYEQYKEGRLDWFDDAVWPLLCIYWCSEDFKKNG